MGVDWRKEARERNQHAQWIPACKDFIYDLEGVVSE